MGVIVKFEAILAIGLLSIFGSNSFFLTENSTETYMSKEEREMLKREAMDMFYHGYYAYMNNAYPADELMPLSCKGRYRNSEPSRGNVDEALGNFSLTLIDSMDTLVILGDFDEFEKAVKLVIRDVTFDTNVVVSVFETNIRILGGLLSGHVLSEVVKMKYHKMTWYNGELLDMAKDLGYRLLPAFNTTTGIPYGRVNLKNGIKPNFPELTRDTCTACAGTMILEMAALSRLTGEPIFEQKAHKTMDELWNLRHRTSNLMGTILNVHSGDWIRRDSGVGAGIDSYYEYCLKAYILLSDEKYLRRFNTHYSAVMTYISQGPMLLDVHMHKPNTNTKNFMDALLAFWPGLQVLKGDLKPAIETHEMLYQVMRRHKFIPEAFTTDFQIHWGQHPLRPEFLESTYFLYRATGDHYYLHVGRNVLRSLQTYARVACGYASVKDVRTGAHEDSMDSFVLAETFKYLYLLFADPSDIPINLDDYLFTTEAHFLPLSISRYSTPKNDPTAEELLENTVGESDQARSCVLEKYVGHILRQNLRNLVEGICPERKFSRKLYASQFQSYNKEHLKLLNDMGITIAMLSDGRMQLVHNYVTAASKTDANEGVLFMQEMVELSKTQSPDNIPQSVSYNAGNKTVVLSAGPANFGKSLRSNEKVSATVSVATPLRACESLQNADVLQGRIVIVERGECMFVEKARKLEKAGAVGGIIVDNIADSSSDTWPLFAMSGDGKDDVNIPVVFLFAREAKTLINAVEREPNLNVTLSQLETNETEKSRKLDADNTLERLKGSLEGIIYKPDIKQKKASEEDSADYTVRSYRVTVPGGVNSDAIIVKNKVPTFQKSAKLKSAGESDDPIIHDSFAQSMGDLDPQLRSRIDVLVEYFEDATAKMKIRKNAATDSKARRSANVDADSTAETKTRENAATDSKARRLADVDAGSTAKTKTRENAAADSKARRSADVDAIIKARKARWLKSKEKLAELRAAELELPYYDSFGHSIDVDPLTRRHLAELMRHQQIRSTAKTKKGRTDSTAMRVALLEVIMDARSFIAAAKDAEDESTDKLVASLEMRGHLKELSSLMAASRQPEKVDQETTEAGDQVRGPVVVRKDTEEKNRSDQAEDDSSGSTSAAADNTFEMGEQEYRDLIVEIIVDGAEKPVAANEGANSSGGSEKDEL